MRLELIEIPLHPGPFTGATGRTGLVRAMMSATVPARLGVATGNRRGPSARAGLADSGQIGRF
jgi:hypothetical protein